jgi:hypothetical protein
MTRTRSKILAAAGGLTLAASLGAGPATQPTRGVAAATGAAAPAPAPADGWEYARGPSTTRDLALIAPPAAPAPFPHGSRVIVPSREHGMPNASVYVTPRAEWIPRPFNGGTFYLIPCDKTANANAGGAPAPSPTVAGRAAVDWGRLLARPSTQPASVAPAR